MTLRPAALMLIAVLALMTALAWPVLRHPNAMIFGAELVGRHPDPFAAMAVMVEPARADARLQPLTDLAGHLAARSLGAIAAYNAVTLLSFPAAAIAAFCCARTIGLSQQAAAVAGAAFALTPQHLAHAAYHPHVAQTQWMPLAIAATVAATVRTSFGMVALLVAAVAAMIAADFYTALVAIEILPIVGAATWWAVRSDGSARAAVRGAACAAIVVVVGLLAASFALHMLARSGSHDLSVAGTTAADAQLYSARWWSFLAPPVQRGAFGAIGEVFWTHAGTGPDLLEQQTSIDWAIAALAAVGAAAAVRRPGSHRRGAMALIAVGMWAAFSASQPWTHSLLPVFRSYARLGMVVALVAAVAAGLGAEFLWRPQTAHHRGRRCAVAGLLCLAAINTFPTTARARDVMPTSAHRFLTDSSAAGTAAPFRALDCVPSSSASSMDGWLLDGRVAPMADPFADCSDPHLAEALAAGGFTDVIVRRGARDGHAIPTDPALSVRAEFKDALVMSVPPLPPAISTVEWRGFFAAEQLGSKRWRWMGSLATWRVVNATACDAIASLDVRIGAADGERTVTLLVDDQAVDRITARLEPAWHQTASFALSPGSHELRWLAGPAAPVLSDRRALTVRVFDWRWDSRPAPSCANAEDRR